MSSASRRPTSVTPLSLVLPKPPLSSLSSIFSPHTPRNCTPSPHLFPCKSLVASPRTSIDSWGSSNGAEEDVSYEWKPEQLALLARTLDALPAHLLTPFNGPIPPGNLLDKLARAVSNAQGPLEWPHSIRSTRAKLVELSRERHTSSYLQQDAIEERDEYMDDGDAAVAEATPSASPRKRLYRQSSMDFLPEKDKDLGSLSKLSTRLQRTDRVVTSYHPYARPTRSPSPSAMSTSPTTTTFPTDVSSARPSSNAPFPSATAPAAPVASRTLRPRTSSTSIGARMPIPVRRASTLNGPAQFGSTGVLGFGYALPTLSSLKRAPSFGSENMSVSTRSSTSSTKEKAQSRSKAKRENVSPGAESEGEDLVRRSARAKKGKRSRPRSGSASSNASTPKKRREVKDTSKDKTPTVSPASTLRAKARPKRTRASSMFGAELPQPQSQSQLPGVSQSPIQTRTRAKVQVRKDSILPETAVAGVGLTRTSASILRALDTPMEDEKSGPCTRSRSRSPGDQNLKRPQINGIGRRISFGGLALPEKATKKASDPNGLGSAFQLA